MANRAKMWFGVLGLCLLVVIFVLAFRALGRPAVGEIQAMNNGPYRPGQEMVLSLRVDSRSPVMYSWSAPDGGEFTAPTNAGSTKFIVPSKGPVRVVCAVIINGAKYERVFPIQISSAGAPPPSPSGEPGAPQAGTAEVLSGVTFARGLDIGVDTSERNRAWVKPEDGVLKMAYPGDPSWGAAFVTVGKPKDPPRPGRDYSAFKALEVEMRGESGGETVDIGIKDRNQPDDGSEAKATVKLSPGWTTHRFDLSRFADADLRQLYVLCEFVFDPPEKPRTIYVRRIRYLN